MNAYWSDLALCAFALVVLLWLGFRKPKRKPMARRNYAKPWSDPRCSITQFKKIMDTDVERQAR